ncbi:hypothetical protein SAMN05444678_102239 [Sphingomonas sp. YR710]|uniref:hypothetical protein n=1 Tax=Sphingomonas sp. YR710 TaxID=1882773 RepID=UPI00088187A4|nr:hypothetical protein [Sphingomonas sp. YR710]SDC30092.1 hypothetical protein SAMN05444678_102239 [Sphingomonas sp. YR710]
MGWGAIIDFLIGGVTVVAGMTFATIAIVWIGEQTGIAIDQMFGVGGPWEAERRREEQPPHPADEDRRRFGADAICAVVDHAEPSA